MGCSSTPRSSTPPSGARSCGHFVREICGCKAGMDSHIDHQGQREAHPFTGRPEACLRPSAAGWIPRWRLHWPTRQSARNYRRFSLITACCARGNGQRRESFSQKPGIEIFTTVDASDAVPGAPGRRSSTPNRSGEIGESFIRTFEQEATRQGRPHYLVQGTIYPDVIESRAPERSKAAAHQDPPQCGRAARTDGLRAGRAAAISVQG